MYGKPPPKPTLPANPAKRKKKPLLPNTNGQGMQKSKVTKTGKLTKPKGSPQI